MRKRLLAFNGGGCLTTTAAVWLNRLTRSGHIDLSHIYSYSGTSAGAILAAMICKPDPVAPSDLVQLSKEISRAIFSKKRIPWLPSWANTVLSGSSYESKRLKEVLAHHLGGKQVRLGDCKNRVVIPVWDLSGKMDNTNASGPIFFHNHEPLFHPQRLEWPLYEVVAASCAAPTYFDASEYAGHTLCDGGIVENTSALANFAICRDKYRGLAVELEDISILSIGNGSKPYVQNENLKPGWKTPNMVQNLIASLTQGNTQLSKRVLSGICNSSFHRLEPVMPFEVSLDDYKKIELIDNWAQNIDLKRTEKWCQGYFN